MIPEDPNRRHERDSPAALRKQRQDKQQATTQVRKTAEAWAPLRSLNPGTQEKGPPLLPRRRSRESRVGRALGPLTQLSDSSRVSRADLQSVQCQKTFAENCLSEFELELCLALN